MRKIAEFIIKAEDTNTSIKFENFIVKKDEIHVTSQNTSYAHYKRMDFSDNKISDAINKLKKIKDMARKRNVKLKNYSQAISELNKLSLVYHSQVKEYNKLFHDLYMNWKRIENKKDLFYSPTYNLEERIPEYGVAKRKGWQIEHMFHGGQVLSQLNAIDRRLDDAERELSIEDDDKVKLVSISV